LGHDSLCTLPKARFDSRRALRFWTCIRSRTEGKRGRALELETGTSSEFARPPNAMGVAPVFRPESKIENPRRMSAVHSCFVISLQSPATPGPPPANHRAATEHPSLKSCYLTIACASSRASSSRVATLGCRHRLPVPNRTFSGVGRTHDSKIKSAAAVVSAEAARPFHSQGR
jgi:hypothetical protein